MGNSSFPKLQQLPKKAKLPIWYFLQEQLSNFKGEKEIPRRMKLLLEAVKEIDDDEDENGENEDPEAEGAGGPYDTILHTACVVGNYVLVVLQIEAGVDLFALDRHSWTALMVATAQGHADCANLLSLHMNTKEFQAAPPQSFLPSRFTLTRQQRELITINIDYLTAVASPTLRRMTAIRSNHPIPPHLKTFYYEIEVVSEDVTSHWCV